jgi:hypothetical protein
MKLIYFLICFLIVSCKGAQQIPDSTADSKQDKKITLTYINSNSTDFKNKHVKLNGFYMGYRGKICIFPQNFINRSPKTRSDWIFSDGINCIYVTGGRPKNLNPIKDKNVNIIIHASVRCTRNNKLYLQYLNSQILK